MTLKIKDVWDKESSWGYLQMHEKRGRSNSVKAPVMLGLKAIDWDQSP